MSPMLTDRSRSGLPELHDLGYLGEDQVPVPELVGAVAGAD